MPWVVSVIARLLSRRTPALSRVPLAHARRISSLIDVIHRYAEGSRRSSCREPSAYRCMTSIRLDIRLACASGTRDSAGVLRERSLAMTETTQGIDLVFPCQGWNHRDEGERP